MDTDHVEAILVWSTELPDKRVTQWLIDSSFQVNAMVSGLLITGTQALFEQVFEVQIDLRDAPIRLPIPETLRLSVSSIIIPKERRITS